MPKARATFTVTLHTVGDALTDANISEIEGLLDEAIERQMANVGLTPEDYDGFAEMFSVEFKEVEY